MRQGWLKSRIQHESDTNFKLTNQEGSWDPGQPVLHLKFSRKYKNKSESQCRYRAVGVPGSGASVWNSRGRELGEVHNLRAQAFSFGTAR